MNDAALSHLRPSDLRALTQLISDAVVGGTDVAEAVHAAIAERVGIRWIERDAERMGGISGLVYRSIRGITNGVARVSDRVLHRTEPLLNGEGNSSRERDAVIAILNGVLGDHLAATGNPLALSMQLRRGGQPLVLHPNRVAEALPHASSYPIVWIHGLCMNDTHWTRQGHNHATAAERDLPVTSVMVRYNTGLHISTNGQTLATLLERLVEAWPQPVEQLALVGHSMGGLVARSAIHYATEQGLHWPQHLSTLACLGTPHHGAPLERGGGWIDYLLGTTAVSAPLARLGQIRSDGITDLRYGYLRDADWKHPKAQQVGQDTRTPTPLPPHIQPYLMAVSTGTRRGDIKDRILGDGLVPLDSALGCHPDPDLALPVPREQQWVGYDMNHFDLLGDYAVYRALRTHLAGTL
ncbi:permease [Longimonas halophila]|uniref:Permease n=1 Tax=Longimonas halophila TaxID=1469170 RepID=A0A2H3NK18_9BACT|nr:permease [Longimonas halophila]PEN06217.1 permease [Longimonas halophila]